mgnify:CR=1 FL=1
MYQPCIVHDTGELSHRIQKMGGGILVHLLGDDESPAQRREAALHPHAFFRRLGQVEIAGVFQVRTLVEVAFKGTAQETHVVLL